MREIYLSARDETLVTIVDDEDYEFVMQWKWSWKRSDRKNKNRLYAKRAVSVWEHGVRVKCVSIYLHHVILQRAGKRKPSPLHTADHKRPLGTIPKSLNNTRDNLRWASKRTQSRNRVFADAPAEHHAPA